MLALIPSFTGIVFALNGMSSFAIAREREFLRSSQTRIR
jgi:hypothetical protein